MSWQERFTDAVNICGANSDDLKSRVCKDTQNIVLQNYNNYYREARGDLDAYSKMQMTPGLNLEIENKIKHYSESCNNLYPMYRKMFQDECGMEKKTVSKNLIIFGVIGIAILLILLGFFVKDELMKKVLWGLGGLIILLVGVYYIHQIFFTKKEEKIIPLF